MQEKCSVRGRAGDVKYDLALALAPAQDQDQGGTREGRAQEGTGGPGGNGTKGRFSFSGR